MKCLGPPESGWNGQTFQVCEYAIAATDKFTELLCALDFTTWLFWRQKTGRCHSWKRYYAL